MSSVALTSELAWSGERLEVHDSERGLEMVGGLIESVMETRISSTPILGCFQCLRLSLGLEAEYGA